MDGRIEKVEGRGRRCLELVEWDKCGSRDWEVCVVEMKGRKRNGENDRGMGGHSEWQCGEESGTVQRWGWMESTWHGRPC